VRVVNKRVLFGFSPLVTSQSLVICLECRGLEPIELVLAGSGPFNATGTSGTVFKKIEFDEGDWAEYDDDADHSVSVMNVTTRFVRG
jgi:hypothetical protein